MIYPAGTALSAAAPWKPTALGPIIWLDATQLGLSDGASVSGFTDLSGHGNHFVQANVEQQPTFEAEGINGLGSVLFDGLDDIMDLTHAPTTAFTFWSVWRPLEEGAAGRQRLYADPAGNRLIGYYDGLKSIYTGAFLNNGSVSPPETLAYIVQCSPSGRFFRVNGDTQADNLASGALSGVAQMGQSTQLIHGYVGEYGLLDRVLSNAELALLTAYISTKWGVSA